MRAAVRATIVFLVASLSIAAWMVPIRPASADPTVGGNGDGTSTAYWNLTTPADYVLQGTQLAGGTASLGQTTTWWNSTTQADFAGPSASTNIDLGRSSGTVDLQDTAGAPQTLTLQPNAASGQDSYLDSTPSNRNNNYGTATTMLLDSSGNTIQRPVIRFSLSALPANALIEDATLSLYMNAGVGNSFVSEVHYLTTAWTEGGVTWNTPWGTGGGDFPGYVAAQTLLTNTAGWARWNVTQLVDLWYRGHLPNDGVILTMPAQGVSSQKSFRTSDYFVSAYRPQLVISYRVLGATGTYTSKVGGPGTPALWNSISWNATSLSLATDEFGGTALNASRWSWMNPPASYDVGSTVPGSLWLASSTGVDVWGATFTGNVLVQPIVGNFTAIAKSTATLDHNFQKTGLLVYLNARNWFSVGSTYVSSTSSVQWAVTSTQDGVSTSDANVSGAPSTSWVEVVRSGNAFTAYTSADGVSWTSRYTFSPAVEYPVEVRVGFFAADGRSGFPVSPSLDYVRVTFPYVPTVAVTTRTGDVDPPDASWSGWSAAYPTPSGSSMTGTSSYVEFRLSLSMGTPTGWLSPQVTPAVGDVNLSWTNYAASGTVTTSDLVAGDVAAWGIFNAVQSLNGESISYAYSLDSGASWTAVTPGASLAGASVASGTIRFRAMLSTSDPVVTPTLTQMTLTFTHHLDHFYVTAPASAAAGSDFTVTVTAKDAANGTISSWTGIVALVARLADGVTHGGGVLGTTSVTVASGGTATLTVETYTRAETIRILASNGTAEGLSANLVVGPGAVNSIALSPSNVTLLLLDDQVFTAQATDAYGNAVPAASYAWSVTGDIGTLNASTGDSVTLTTSALGNGTVEASSGSALGAAQVHVLAGARPWLDVLAPAPGAWLTGVTTIRYTNSTDAVSVQFAYDAGTGWTAIGTTSALTGTFLWGTQGLNFTGGQLRVLVTNNRTITNTTTVSPIGVDNSPPTIALGAASDYQSVNGTLLLTYTTSPDTVRVDFSYFNGTWHAIGSTTAITGAYLWTPGARINGVTVRAVATDRVGLIGVDEEMGVGRIVVGTNGPSLAAIPTLHVAAGIPYGLNLTFYVSDPDTALADLAIWTADSANITVTTGSDPSLTITYATAGSYSVTLWVSDGGNTAWTILSIVAGPNSPPVLVRPLPAVTFLENMVGVNGLGAPVTSFFSDPDGDPLNFSVHGATNVSTRLNANGTMDFWGPMNWHGMEALLLRATDPAGGFAEGAFLVTVVWVNQPPTLDPLPSMRLNASQSYALDLTAYMHDVDTPLALLNVTVDSPYVTVQGHLLLLNFPGNWTGTGFNVTISDGSHTATQYVGVTLVIPPRPPEWWQAPYVLAVPPVGLFMVVAMFVQRRRWRPAKAFLVDERGQLLREFTLDGSCGVTYDEARQAGALDAVDKDVRVAKYHARAVHGDVLSLVMLAVGPADTEEVEFARGLLANVQDKLEDRVKQRVEEARSEEANLEGARRQVEEERADLQARARVFGDMVNALTLARGKLEAESRALQTQMTDLASREETVVTARKAVDDGERQLGKLHASLDRTSSEIEAQRKEIAERLESLGAREAELSPKERALGDHAAALATKEKDLTERGETLSAAETKFTADLQDYHVKAQDLRKLEEELAEERKSLDDLTVQLDAQQAQLNSRTSEVEAREKETEEGRSVLQAKLVELEPRETSLAQRETDLASRESALQVQTKALADEEGRLNAVATDLRMRDADLATRTQSFEEERKALDQASQKWTEDRAILDARAADLQRKEAEIASTTEDLADLKANLGPREAALLDKEAGLQAREKTLAAEHAAFESQQDLVAAKALEIQQQMAALQDRETALQQEKLLLQDAKGAFDAQHQELEAKTVAFEGERKRREADLEGQERTLGEARMRLTKDRQDFEAATADKNQWIASKEIELEAKEQGLADRETEIRAQAEENAKHLTDLATREEDLEIESAKFDKTSAELESRKAELGAMARDVEARTAKLRDEEARKAEELRTWQTTLESEQALLKEQKETFEREMQDVRESWAGRMLRVEQREEELKDREAKVQADVEWVARNESEIGKREKTAAEGLKAAEDLRAEAERMRSELEQRALEIESRERSVREEAAAQSVELEKRSEALQDQETELAGRKAQWESELALQTQKLKDRQAELSAHKDALDAKEADLTTREGSLASTQEILRRDEERLDQERVDLQMTEQRIQAAQLELTQAREKFDAEALRTRTEADAVRQSLAAKEADLLSERERLERESMALQDKLGSKAKELVTREKAIAAHEDELRAEEHDLEARTREIDSRERQAEARLADIGARESALAQSEEAQKARQATFDETVRQFQAETAMRQQEWKDLQATLKSQEAQLAHSTETRQAEIQKRMEELEQRERSLNALQTQTQIERTGLEAQSKAQAAKQEELEANAARSDKRLAELKSMEEALLGSQQSFEKEKASWEARRSEELKQLEATRDAAGEQTQQAERLIEESQRRVYVAAEAEKAAKRQATELAAAQAELDRRRAEAEKAEKALESQMAQLREASQALAAKEVALSSRAKDLDDLGNRLTVLEKRGVETTEELRTRKASLDKEAERIASLAAQMDKRQAEEESRRTALEGRLADLAKRDQVLTTELQRADNLMDDLNRKEAELVARDKGFASREKTFQEKEAALARRDAELVEGMQTLDRMKKEHEQRAREVDEHHRAASQTRKEAEMVAAEAEKMKAQAEAMQAEVSKNMRFLQKKALDVLDREEKIRTRENQTEEQDRALEARAQVLEKKERALDAEREELAAQLEKAMQENKKLKAKLSEAEKAGQSAIDTDEWKRDIENRVKIIQKKALELLDREERLRKKEEELKVLAAQLGADAAQ